jgi:hypothetical protein
MERGNTVLVETESGIPGISIMSNLRRGYVAYLLRLWQVSEAENAPWRASLESPHSGQRRGFASLAELFTFLENEIGQAIQSQPAPGSGEKGGDIDKLCPT